MMRTFTHTARPAGQVDENGAARAPRRPLPPAAPAAKMPDARRPHGRRTLLHPCLLAFALAAAPPALRPGPYLLLDDFLVERSVGLTRKVQRPRRRLDGPVVTGKED